jgi:hypothetical protein
MNRRQMVLVLVALGAAPHIAPGQAQGRVRRIGMLWGSSKSSSKNSGATRAFVEGMREAGHREQIDYVIGSRYAGGR